MSLAGIIIDLAASFLPAGQGEKQRAERLAELRAGAPEDYFEERRALETYRPSLRLNMLAWLIFVVALVWILAEALLG